MSERPYHEEIQFGIEYACEHKSWNMLGRVLVELLNEIQRLEKALEDKP
jgi:hypothetical protein